MGEPKIKYYLDKLDQGDESDWVEIDREALHGQEISPEIATVIMLDQLNRRLRDLSVFLRNN